MVFFMDISEFTELSLAPVFSSLPRPVLMRVVHRPGRSWIRPHAHSWAQFMCCSHGVISVSTANGSYVLSPDMGLWIPPQVEHSVQMVQQICQESLYVGGELGVRLSAGGGVVSMTPLVRELIREAARLPVEYDESGEEGRLIAVLLDQLAKLPARNVQLPFPRDSRLQKICHALIDDPAGDLPLTWWADHAGASTRTLTRLFEAETGMGFRAWRQRLRLQRAMLLLGDGHPVSAVATEVGYRSASAFIVAFRQCFGFAPGGVTSRAG